MGQASSATAEEQELPDRFRLDRRYDVERLQADVRRIVDSLNQQSYIYYAAVPLAMNIGNPPGHDWAAEPMLRDCHYLQASFREFRADITSIRLMQRAAHGWTDPPAVH